jgi:hypothetical protein
VPSTVEWTSSDSTVAVVDGDGVVHGVRMGEAWIRAAVGSARDSAHVVVTGFTTMAAGGRFSCGGMGSAGTWCWGGADFIPYGGGNDAQRALGAPRRRLASDVAFATLAASDWGACGLDASGALWCWRWPNDDLAEVGRLAPDVSFARLYYYNQSFCGVTTASDVRCPGAISFPAGEPNVRDFGVTARRGCMVDLTGALYCQGNPLTPFDAPTTEPVLVTGVPALAAVAVGDTRTCARESNGTAWCWSYDQASPGAVRVPGGLAFVSLDVDGDAVCGVTTTAALYCWGSSTTGQLPGSASGAIPVRVPEVTGAVAVDLSSRHGCALTQTGAIYCWGHNDHGELGDGTFVDHAEPTPVSKPIQ